MVRRVRAAGPGGTGETVRQSTVRPGVNPQGVRRRTRPLAGVMRSISVTWATGAALVKTD
ncbi:hypothetical protein GCM10010417_17670 [Streptomyces carpaticus]